MPRQGFPVVESVKVVVLKCPGSGRALNTESDWKNMYPVREGRGDVEVDKREDWTTDNALLCSPVSMAICK